MKSAPSWGLLTLSAVSYGRATFDKPFLQRISTTSTNTTVATGAVTTDTGSDELAALQGTLIHGHGGIESSSGTYPSEMLWDIRAESRAVLGGVLVPPTQLRNRKVDLVLQFAITLAGTHRGEMSGSRLADAACTRSALNGPIVGAGQNLSGGESELTTYANSGVAAFGTGLVTLTATVDPGTIDFLWESKQMSFTCSFQYASVPEPTSILIFLGGLFFPLRRTRASVR